MQIDEFVKQTMNEVQTIQSKIYENDSEEEVQMDPDLLVSQLAEAVLNHQQEELLKLEISKIDK